MAKYSLGTVMILVFSVTALIVAASTVRNNEATAEHVNNLTRRECVEVYDANGQQIVDDDGETQFNCDNYFPTTESIQARIASTGLVNDPTKIPAYYTGWPYNEVEGELGGWISAWMDAYLARQPSPQPQATGYYWWWTAVPRDWWYAQNTWFSNHQGDGPDFVFSPKMSSTFDACISESLATMNVGKEIFLFVPSEYVLGSEPNRQWWSIEYPVLTNTRPLPPPPPPQPPAQQDSRSRSVAKTSANSKDYNRLFRRECWAEEDMDGNWEYDAEQCDEFLPTLGQCQGNLQQNGFINDPSYVPVYYTGWPGGTSFQDVTTWIASYMAFYVTQQGARPKGWYWFWSALNNDWYNVQRQYITDNFAQLKNVNLEGDSLTADTANEVLTVCLCEALAVSCLAPTVVIAVPYDYILGAEAGRHWWTIEFGALTRNAHVNRIYRVDPSPLDTLENPETKCDDVGRWIPKLIWTRGVDPEAPQPLTCAIFLKIGPDANAPAHAVLPPPPPAPPPPSLLLTKREEAQSVETTSNDTHFNKLSRRECVATTDVMTGEVQYLPDNCGTLAPTLADCVEHWNQKGDDGVILISDPTKLSIYYTGWNKDEDSENMYTWFASFAENYIKVQKDPKENGWYWFWSTWDKDWDDVQEAYLEGHEDEIENIKPKGQGLDLGTILDGCMNEAFATNCIHPRVFLMVPQDYVLGSEPKRHWWSIEFGALTKNPNVQEIFRVDPRPRDPDEEGCTGYAPVLIWSRAAGDDEHPMDFNCDIFISDTAVPKPPAADSSGLLIERENPSVAASQPEESGRPFLNDFATAVISGSPNGLLSEPESPSIGGRNRYSRGRSRRRPTPNRIHIGMSIPQQRLHRRQCTERTPNVIDTRWDCYRNLRIVPEFVIHIQVGGLTSQENIYTVYFTGFDNNDIEIGQLKRQIATGMKWYIQCIQNMHQSYSSSFTKYWCWYFDVVYDRPGSWFAAQEEWIEMHSPPDAMDEEDIYFSEEAPQWFGKCTSQAFATACEQATIILFAPYDLVLADHPNRHFYSIEDDVFTRSIDPPEALSLH